MRPVVKLSLCAILAVSAAVANAADLEFHGYARGGLGVSSQRGNQACFSLGSGDAKIRLGNECDWVLEPTFEMAFSKLDDKSVWGVHFMPGFYGRFDDDRFSSASGSNRATEEIPAAFKEFYFFGRSIPQLGGGEVWMGRRWFDRLALGAINDQFLEAQDGVGAGVANINVGGPKLSVSLTYDPFTNGDAASINDRNMAVGAHVDSIQTFNKDSSLQVWAHYYVPVQNTHATDGGSPLAVPKRKSGQSASITHIAGLGAAGTLTLAARYDINAYTDQQNGGAAGKQQLRGVVVYGVTLPAIRSTLDLLGEYRHLKNVTQVAKTTPTDSQNDWYQAAFRTDTHVYGPFRFLFEAGVDQSKSKGRDTSDKTVHRLVKVTPCLAVSGGNDAWSRPTFRLFYNYARWNKNATADVLGAWKDSGAPSQFQGKTEGGTLGLQAEGWW